MVRLEIRMPRDRFNLLEPETREVISEHLDSLIRNFLSTVRRGFASEEPGRGFAPEQIEVEWVVLEDSLNTVDLRLTVFVSDNLLPLDVPSIDLAIRDWLLRTPILAPIRMFSVAWQKLESLPIVGARTP